MGTETYLTKHLLAPIVPIWADNGANRRVHLWPVTLPPTVERDEHSDVIIVYWLTGEGERIEDLRGDTLINEGYVILATAPNAEVLERFRTKFEELVYTQPESRRLRVVGSAATLYNEDLSAIAAQWNVTVQA